MNDLRNESFLGLTSDFMPAISEKRTLPTAFCMSHREQRRSVFPGVIDHQPR